MLYISLALNVAAYGLLVYRGSTKALLLWYFLDMYQVLNVLSMEDVFSSKFAMKTLGSFDPLSLHFYPLVTGLNSLLPGITTDNHVFMFTQMERGRIYVFYVTFVVLLVITGVGLFYLIVWAVRMTADREGNEG